MVCMVLMGKPLFIKQFVRKTCIWCLDIASWLYRIECKDGMILSCAKQICQQLAAPIGPRACCLPHLRPPAKEQASVHRPTVTVWHIATILPFSFWAQVDSTKKKHTTCSSKPAVLIMYLLNKYFYFYSSISAFCTPECFPSPQLLCPTWRCGWHLRDAWDSHHGHCPPRSKHDIQKLNQRSNQVFCNYN